jgi:sarcosine oxidase subunit gamma
MFETTMRRSALDEQSILPCSELSLHDPGPALRFILRGRQEVATAAAAGFGISLPSTPCRGNSDGVKHALWLGPDEWLLIAPDSEPVAFVRAISESINGQPHSLVDVSHRTSAVVLSGPRVSDALNHGCPLDLGLPSFPVGMCTRTLLARAEVILWRLNPESFRLEVARSYIPYMVAFLTECTS